MKPISTSMSFVFGLFLSGSVLSASYSLELDLNSGYNNNVFLESDDLVINEAEDDSSQKDLQTQMAVTANVEFWDEANSDASIMLDYFQERLLDNGLDTTVTTLSLPLHFYSGDYRYGITFTRQAYNLSDIDVLSYATSKLGVAKNIGRNKLYFHMAFTKKTPEDESYVDYEGDSRNINLKYKVGNGERKWYWQGNLFRNDYIVDGLSNNGGYLKTKYMVINNRHTMAVALKIKRTLYDEDELTTDKRLDRQVSVNYNHEYFIRSAIQVYFDTTYVRNSSNISYDDENYNYDQWIHTLGTRFVF